jgi:glutamate/tyrosine decarboxylase-like PLP-dependent enzyme
MAGIPPRGLPKAEILERLRALQASDADWRGGRTWSLVYHLDAEHHQFLKEAHHLFFSENRLNPFAFHSLRTLEQEVVGMTAGMLHGDERTVGTINSGGTESLYLAVFSARERARRIAQPEIVQPATQHPALAKAAHALGIRVKKVPADAQQRADVAAMERAITSNTILLCASAPQYPHGVLDPIPELGRLAERHRIPFHVDACLGGFMLPWLEALGQELPPWDFRVPGVTSISADLHKMGYGAKGASALLYRSMDYLKHQFYVDTDYPGGIYAVPGFLGTRGGGPLAAAWAGMKALGQNGYREAARKVMDATGELRAALLAIPQIELVGQSCMNVLAYKTRNNRPDIFVLADRLQDKGWMVDRQQFPNCIHLTVQAHNRPVLQQYARDVREAICWALEYPEVTAQGEAALYGLMARIPMRGMVKTNVQQLLIDMYGGGAQAEEEGERELPASPAWMGWLNRMLTAWQRLLRR